MYNEWLRECMFLEITKKQLLILISKGKGYPGDTSAYRPLWMVDTSGKLPERLLKPRLKVLSKMVANCLLCNMVFGSVTLKLTP